MKELYLGEVLEKRSVHASAPARLDVGGTWDIKGLSLTHEWLSPTTTNIAISLRTHAQLFPYEYGKVKVSNSIESEEFAIDAAPLQGPLRLLTAIASHFGLHGYELKLTYEAPPFSGLGGSGTVGVAFIGALQAALCLLRSEEVIYNPQDAAFRAYSIEDSLGISLCGMQDHCAAAFGGISRWSWLYTTPQLFKREHINDEKVIEELNERLIVAYLGKGHKSKTVNEKQMESFWNVTTRKNWYEINEISHEFYDAVSGFHWHDAARLLARENEIRISLVPERLNETAYSLLNIANAFPVGFAAAGAGDGGCVWVLCANSEDKTKIEEDFRKVLGIGAILPLSIENTGIQLEY